MTSYGRTRTATSLIKEKKNKATLMNESGKLITKAIAYKFDVLFNDGKKIACLQNGCKM